MRILQPENLETACKMLNNLETKTRQPEEIIQPIAGGTDIMANWNDNLINNNNNQNLTLLDLSQLTKELKYIKWNKINNNHHPDENNKNKYDDKNSPYLALGALTTFWDVIQNNSVSKTFPLLSQAAKQIGALQIQTRGTWAGNIINASPAADGVTALLAYNARVVLKSENAEECIPLKNFYLNYKITRRKTNQLIREIQIPINKYDLQYYEKVGARKALAIAKLGIAITLQNKNLKWRVAVCSMAPYVKRCPAIEKLLFNNNKNIINRKPSPPPVNKPQDFLNAINKDLKPINDLRSTAEYRRIVLSRILYHCLNNYYQK